jgi:monoterpene epsilon-lactone hydrolase
LNTPTKLTLFLALSISMGTSAAKNWVVSERELPIPAGASGQLQQAIAEAGKPSVAARSFAPTSEKQWRELIAMRAVSSPLLLTELGASLNLSISRDEIAGVAVHQILPNKIKPQNKDRLFVYLHGGAYVFGGGDKSVREGALIASMSKIPAVSIDYRMPPDHPSPAAVDDVVAVYRELLKTHKPTAIAMGGTSAGGGLTLAVVHQIKSLGLPVPGALYLGTPWADLTTASDSLHTNEGIDRILVTHNGMLGACAQLYAAGEDLHNPLISPVYGDFSGFPPTYLVTGTRDMLLSDTARVHRKLRVAGVVADLNVYEGLSHAEYWMVTGSPEWQQTYEELAAFLLRHLAP